MEIPQFYRDPSTARGSNILCATGLASANEVRE